MDLRCEEANAGRAIATGRTAGVGGAAEVVRPGLGSRARARRAAPVRYALKREKMY